MRATIGHSVSRRSAIAGLGAAAAFLGLREGSSGRVARDIEGLVNATQFVDTHEHLLEEGRRTAWRPGPPMLCDDWSVLWAHYIDSDLLVAGMSSQDAERVQRPNTASEEKWSLIEPFWPMVRNTGYGQAICIAVERLYGVKDINRRTIGRIADGYRKCVTPGMYKTILHKECGIEACHVNSIEQPFMETSLPDLLMQDLSIFHFSAHLSKGWPALWERAGIAVTSIGDFHRVIDWWFDRYGPYAVAVKTQVAYMRALDFAQVDAEIAAPTFGRVIAGESVGTAEVKLLDDHIFWYCVGKAREHNLPVKLHTGYLAGQNGMQMRRTATDPSAVSDILRAAPEVSFVLMHMGYPFQEQVIALAKHYHNAYADMCWAWIVNPEASVRFLRDILVTAPANKVLTFGGDYWAVEPIVGHAALARRGIATALGDLMHRGWLDRRAVGDLVPRIMNTNAKDLFRMEAVSRKWRSARL